MCPSARVSVVIPAYNHERFVREAIESVLHQSLQPIEICVVDDGSTDDTLAVVSEFADRVSIISQENAGVSRARNVAARSTRGRYLAFLDSDDIWQPNKLEREIALLESHPAVGLVHCGVNEVDANRAVLRTRLDGLEGSVANDLLLMKSVILGGGSGFAVRRAIFDEVGGFDERLSMSADWDFFYRVARLSEVAFIAEPLLDYRIHGSNLGRNVPLLEQDMFLCFEKAFVELKGQRLLRRKSYGQLYRVLGASYMTNGELTRGLQYLTRSVFEWPPQLAQARHIRRLFVKLLQSRR